MLMKQMNFRQVVDRVKCMVGAGGHRFQKHLDLALAHERSGDKAQAIACYQECLRLNPSSELHKSVGFLYYELQDYLGAIRNLEKAEFDPEVGFYLGICCLNLNALKRAEQILHSLPKKRSMYATKLAEQIEEFKCRRGSRSCHERCVTDAGELREFYQVLNVAFGSPRTTIKQTYRELAKAWHPDRFSHDRALQSQAEERMKLINEAYYRLCNQ